MRILWITHDIFDAFSPYVKGNPTKGRPWIAPLFYSIYKQDGVKLAVLTPVVDGKEQKCTIDDIIYYSVGIEKKGNVIPMNNKLANKYISAINDFRPDIIHVHGTEINFGLLRKYVNANIPIVCSVQGIIPPCFEYLKYSVANIDINKYRSIKNRLGRGGVNQAFRKWKRYIPIEKEIYRLNQYFIGRTLWDKAYVAAFNPQARYFHGEELLRDEFYNIDWNPESYERHRVFISSSEYALKGFHVLLKATSILKQKYPDIKIVAPLSSVRPHFSIFLDYLISEDYNNYLKKEIDRLGLQQNIIFQQRLSAAEMAAEFKKAHVFALPSFVENSPNALGEAMIIGVPSVVTPVGGITSIVENEKSSLFFPSGDYVMMAHQIDRLFSDDKLAFTISKNAKSIAGKRHNIVETTKQYMETYAAILKSHKEQYN